MHRTHIAESILSLFTTRERAASTLGDLIEDRAARGPVWFWTSVFRTALALLWASFTAERSFLTAIGLRGMIMGNLILSIGALLVLLMETPFRALPMWSYQSIGTLVTTAAQFWTGQWVSRRAQGREIAAAIAVLIAQAIFPIFGFVFFGRWLSVPWQFTASGARIPGASAILNLIWILAVLAGAMRIRWRQQSAG